MFYPIPYLYMPDFLDVASVSYLFKFFNIASYLCKPYSHSL